MRARSVQVGAVVAIQQAAALSALFAAQGEAHRVDVGVGDLIGNLLPMLLVDQRTAPDEIYLAETHTNPWWVWPMRRGGDHWPGAGALEWTQFMWKPDNLSTVGLPWWYRDALQPDDLHATQASVWTPTTLEEGELDKLSMGRGSKRV